MEATGSFSSGFMALPADLASVSSANCVILPAPFEQSSTYGHGSSGGAASIIEASHQVEFFDSYLGFEPCMVAGGIATLDPVPTDDCDAEVFAERLRDRCADWISKGKRVFTIGGEHTSIVGAVRAHAEHYDNLTVLQLDAHADLRDTYEGSAWNHACAMRRVLDFHSSIVAVGVRSMCIEEAEYIAKNQIPTFHAEKLVEQNRVGEDWIQPIVDCLKSRVYITLDCDVLDPAEMPATGTPEPGGLSWKQLSQLIEKIIAEREIVGLDINELAPIPGLRHPQFSIAKLLYRAIGMIARTQES